MIQKLLLTASEVHAALVREVDSLITHYRDDLLVHDLNNLKKCLDGTPFLHFTRDTGTYMVMLIGADEYPAKGERVPYLFGSADREHCLNGVWDVVNHCTDGFYGQHVCHYYDGRTLRKVTNVQARNIASEYTATIRSQWARGICAAEPVGCYVGLGL